MTMPVMTQQQCKGGPGSGNFNHTGRPGEVGGSGGGGISLRASTRLSEGSRAPTVLELNRVREGVAALPFGIRSAISSDTKRTLEIIPEHESDEVRGMVLRLRESTISGSPAILRHELTHAFANRFSQTDPDAKLNALASAGVRLPIHVNQNPSASGRVDEFATIVADAYEDGLSREEHARRLSSDGPREFRVDVERTIGSGQRDYTGSSAWSMREAVAAVRIWEGWMASARGGQKVMPDHSLIHGLRLSTKALLQLKKAMGHVPPLTPVERAFRAAMNSLFVKQAVEARKNVEKWLRTHTNIIDPKKWTRETNELVFPIRWHPFKAGGDNALGEIKHPMPEWIEAPRVLDALRNENFMFAREISNATADRLQAELLEGVEAGETIAQLKNRIMDIDEEWMEAGRAEMIARTETARAYSTGTTEAWKETGVVEGKVWRAAGDACPFCQAMNGTVVELDAGFFEKGESMTVGKDTMDFDYSDVGGPPLHPNCRCALVAELNEKRLRVVLLGKGGPGSGNFNHEGRPGEVGGSGPGGGGGRVVVPESVATIDDLRVISKRGQLPDDTEEYEHFYHAFRYRGDVDSVLSEGISKRTFLSKDEIRDRGAGFAIVRLPKGIAVEGRDVVEVGRTYREWTIPKLDSGNILRVIREVPMGLGGHGIREDELAAYAINHQGEDASDLPAQYRGWFSIGSASSKEFKGGPDSVSEAQVVNRAARALTAAAKIRAVLEDTPENKPNKTLFTPAPHPLK